MSFDVRPRGKFRTLVLRGGGEPVTAKLFGCRVASVTSAGGKRYAALDVSALAVPCGTLAEVDEAIRAAQKDLRFSPLRRLPGGTQGLHVKIPPTAAWDGGGAVTLLPEQRVDAWVRLGNFGAFGYCWLLHRVKLH